MALRVLHLLFRITPEQARPMHYLIYAYHLAVNCFNGPAAGWGQAITRSFFFMQEKETT
jgi:hypothetical protein